MNLIETNLKINSPLTLSTDNRLLMKIFNFYYFSFQIAKLRTKINISSAKYRNKFMLLNSDLFINPKIKNITIKIIVGHNKYFIRLLSNINDNWNKINKIDDTINRYTRFLNIFDFIFLIYGITIN